jgi:carbonic anhydrase
MKRITLTLFLIACVAVGAQSQDMKKVIGIVQKMETELKAMIAQERTERQEAYKALLDEIHSLTKSDHTATPTPVVEEKKAVDNSKQLIARLKEGNKRFVEGKSTAKNFSGERTELTKGQKPYVIVLTCSDSRVPPEYIFDESLGQIFVVRVAGNVVDSVALGSVEYAAEHLHTSLVLVLGHESCGAVSATLAGGEVPPNIGSLVRRIKPAVDRTKAKHLKESEVLSACIEENVTEQIEQSLHQSGVLEEMVEKGEVKIIGGVYDLASGSVRFLEKKNVTEAPSQKGHEDVVLKTESPKENGHGH